MNKKSANKIAHEVMYYPYKCPYCGRIVPNWCHLTKYGCKWCDYRYYQEKTKNVQRLDTNKQI